MRELIIASVIFSLSSLSFANSEELTRRKNQVDDKLNQMNCAKFKAELPSLTNSNIREIKFSKPGSESYELAVHTIDRALKKAPKCIK